MENKILIGLGSKAQIGKDYAAAQLRNYFDVERIAFADALKDDLAMLFKHRNLDFFELLNHEHQKDRLRPLMVAYGNTLRKYNPDVWIDPVLSNREFNHKVTIITDVRYPNEVKRLQSLGGKYIHIITDTPPANAVEEENYPLMLDLADYTIVNNFDETYIEDMKNLVEHLLKNENS
jgi:hypothetical protein